ncbi:MAG TPA: tRNA modification GTPase [Pirellulales bacterium]|nr:tRNA modification GTPase [Pirellulales bacterium]
MFDAQDTIVALASPPGGAARAIVRVSGPQAVACAEQCFAADDGRLLTTLRRPTTVEGSIHLPALPARLPAVLYLWPSSRSYTRQPTVEFHTFGSPPLAEALIAELCRHGARPARPGEFTLRAFLAGRLDLTQAEAVLGVIDARGEGELRTALDQLAGGLALPLSRLRGQLLDVLAQLEAGLDFVEEDIEFISRQELDRQLATAEAELERLLAQVQDRGETAEAVRAVLVGSPNVGKSSLYNALTGEKALVSSEAGTTRDYLSTRLDLGGVACQLTDTAGLTSVSGGIGQAAQDATERQQRQADIEIFCLDATRPLTTAEAELLARSPNGQRIVVLTKIDGHRRAPALLDAVETSSLTGAGLEQLRDRIREAATAEHVCSGVVAATAVRSRESLRRVHASLIEARRLTPASVEELVAAELRQALAHLGEVAGEIYTDDILDRIFCRFCIGK